MKHAFFITSSIELNPDLKFKGTGKRTVFSTRDRLDQTIHTLRICSQLSPDSSIFLIDSSPTHFAELYQVPNLNYFRLDNFNTTIANVVRSYSNKSYCECIMILEFFKHHKETLKQFDFVTKLCGRYFFDETFNLDYYTEKNSNKFFFKNTMTWSGKHIDFLTEEQLPRDLIVNGELTGTYTVAHGFHKDKIDQYEALMFACAQSSMENIKFYYQDVEYALYYFLRIFNLLDDVVTVPWNVHGRSGVTGAWMKY
jgi:hypothetical protein